MKSHSISSKISTGTLSGALLVAVTIATAIVHYKQVFAFLPRDIAGVWLLFWSFGSYLAFFDLGMGPTLAREIAFLAARPPDNRDRRAVANLVATCLRLYMAVAGSVLALAVLCGLIFLPMLRLTSIPTADSLLAWVLFATGACVNLIGNISYAVLTGEGHVATERLTRAASMLIWLGLSAFALRSGYGLIGLSAAWLAHACISRLMAVGAAKVFVPSLELGQGAWSAAVARQLARPSAQWALTQLGALLILQTDNLLIAWNLGTAAIPSYEAAAKVITAIGTIALLRTNASVPYYSRASSDADSRTLRELLYKNVHHGLLIMATAIGFMAFFGPDLFHVWLGPGNFVGYPVLLTLLVMMTLETHHVSHASLTMATGRIPFVRSALVAGALNLVLSLILLHWFGLFGVALGTMLAQMATNNWYAPYVTLKIVKLRPFAYIRQVAPRFTGLLFAFVAVQAVASAAARDEGAVLRVITGGTVAVLLYFVATRSAAAYPSPDRK